MTLVMNESFFIVVVDEYQHLLFAERTKLDRFLKKSSLSFLEGDVPHLIILNFGYTYEFGFSHWFAF